ncbi:cation-translocating P-type ATPase [Nocardioides jiangsuensis]|nr:cation-translocating P-type ATPase [Nocardioides jiangsuensis]
MDRLAERRGLTTAQAAAGLAEHGPNEPPEAPPRGWFRRVLEQLRDPMIMLLLGALVVTVALGDYTDATIIGIVVVLNTSIGVFQEVRAERAIAALGRMAAPQAHVYRDGRLVVVPAGEVVPGDLLRLEAGDIVPADADVVEAFSMQVDESAMTGESVPVARDAGSEVLAGTVVTRGRAVAEVTRTGANSGLGRIAALIATAGIRPTPLQRRLSRLSHLLVGIVLALAALVFGLGLLRGEGVAEMLILAVSLSVAAIPESLPAVVSVALALGAYRMAKRSAVVRWLPAVETLGSVTVIASDKTGTLTEGRMVVQHLWTPTGRAEVTGRGYGTSGAIESAGGTAAPEDLLRDLVLCNDAHLAGPVEGEWMIVGDPMEAALLVAAAKGRVGTAAVRASWERAEEVPFDSERQRMTTLDRWVGAPRGGEGRGPLGGKRGGPWLVVCKGAPEVVLDLVAGGGTGVPGSAVDAVTVDAVKAVTLDAVAADAVAADAVSADAVAVDAVAVDAVKSARGAAHELAEQGFRVIAVAQASYDQRPASDVLERGLSLVGLAAISDPAREGAAKVVAECQAAGVRLVLITGDHPETARAIAAGLGITAAAPEVAVGDMVARGEHRDRVEEIGVYARTKPEQKVDIVQAWQDRGHVVAMTGDGVNDAPALRRADIGVAMGERGTEVARQAADLVLADDDLRTVVVAVAEGRRIFSNIRTFLRYGLSGGFAEVAVILVGPFLGLPLPLNAAQILWVNMLTHGLPGVAFGGEPLDPSVMKRPSMSPEKSVLGEGLARRIVRTGILIGLVSLGAGLLAQSRGEHVQTWVFLTIGLAQLGVAMALRAPRNGAGWKARGLEFAVLGAGLLQVAGVLVPGLRDLLGTEPVTWSTFLLLLGLSLVPGLLILVERVVVGRQR